MKFRLHGINHGSRLDLHLSEQAKVFSGSNQGIEKATNKLCQCDKMQNFAEASMTGGET
jgi:hypothetical protein